MKVEHFLIEKDRQSKKFLELKSNKSDQEGMILQHLTLQKLNEMNHIPDKDISDWAND